VPIASAPFGMTMPGMIDQNSSHRLCRGVKKVNPTLPAGSGSLFVFHEPQKNFVYQSGRLQRVIPAFTQHLSLCKSSEFVVYEWEQT
jgi:hypothetical protein